MSEATSSRSGLVSLGELGLYLGLYRQMVLIRGFEDLNQSLFVRGDVYGTSHLCSGPEGVAVRSHTAQPSSTSSSLVPIASCAKSSNARDDRSSQRTGALGGTGLPWRATAELTS
jgi:hypothetical protein